MEWDQFVARKKLLAIASDLYEEGCFPNEVANLYHDLLITCKYKTESGFRSLISKNLEWEKEDIDELVEKIKENK